MSDRLTEGVGALAGVISRRSALAGGLGLAASGLLAACARDVRPALAPAPAITGEMVVGANLELTGTGSTLGKLQEQALQVGAQALNTSGFAFGDTRLAMRLVVKDNGGDPARAAEASEQLITHDRVSAIIGGTTVETAMSMITVAEQRKVPLLCLNSGDEMTIPLPQRKFVYKLGPNATDVAEVLARELQQRQFGGAALLASADGHGEAGARALPRAFASAGLALAASARLPAGGRAYTDAVKQIVASKAKAVVVWALAPVSAAAVAALRGGGYTGKIFLDPGAGAGETLRGPNGSTVDGAFIVHPTVLGGAPMMATTTSGLAARDFVYRYIQEYGAFGGFAPYSADALNLLAVAARRGKSLDPQRLRGRLEGGAVEGIAGAYAFQPISHGGMEPDGLVLFTA
ncbi:ABC transporter substrate-binding protein, partial [Allorhizocola rhizosphaerae]|uniref:ABC transporter substrate-binding protein n=1 Tax=Allorhizocola rhizosphaerae TaxID=1872709 RepID=UPI0013C3371E